MRRKGTTFNCTHEGCTSSFSRPDRLRNHLRTHTGERPFTCRYPECTKSFGSSQHLRRHEIAHESSFNCTIEGCSEVFKRKDALKKHLDNIHYKKQPKLYKCTECDKQFNKHSWLQSHMYKHTGTFPYICQTEGCAKGFLLPSKLKRHMKVHEGHVCKIPGCGATFLKWSLYMSHLKGFHPKVHTCNICDRKFTHPPNLKTHLEMHKEPLSRKVFACEVPDCPRYYFAEKNLKWHVKTYHEARPYACDKEHCHRAFKTKDALDQHTVRHKRRSPRKKKKPKPSMSAVLSGCEDPRKFTYKTPRKKIVTESSEELTTDGEIEYQDTSSDENINKLSASEMTDASEQIINDGYGALRSIDPQFDETQSCTTGLNKEKKCDLALSEYGSASAIAGPSTKLSEIESKHNYQTQNTLKPPKKHKKLEIFNQSICNSTMSPISDCEMLSVQDSINCYTRAHLLNQNQTNIDALQEKSTSLETISYHNIKSVEDHTKSAGDHTKSVEDPIESEDEDIKSSEDVCNSGKEDNANSSEYETIKVSVFGNVCVWEKSYSGSEEVSSCLSEAEDLLNCEDVLPKRER